MSSYYKPTVHPKTNRVEHAMWIDDYFGRHNYGVKFSDDEVYRPEEVITADRYIGQLEDALATALSLIAASANGYISDGNKESAELYRDAHHELIQESGIDYDAVINRLQEKESGN